MNDAPEPTPRAVTRSISWKLQPDDDKELSATVHCLCLEVEIDGQHIDCCCECWYVGKKIYGTMSKPKRRRSA